ncbi:MAG: NADH-quinone oxidoreductase subunit C [Bacteroidales bacterium]|nr:NADH-quinone oxidoreductase subunit C [Bacteroidales bacterium]
MNAAPEILELQKHFGKEIYHVEVRSDKRAVLTVNPAKITEFAEVLFKKLKLRFIIASAMETDAGFEILYHFSIDASGQILNLRVVLDRENPVIESLTVIFEAANWIEREMHEILGIQFRNHPNPEKLISEGNWAEGVYPYRRTEEKAKANPKHET